MNTDHYSHRAAERAEAADELAWEFVTGRNVPDALVGIGRVFGEAAADRTAERREVRRAATLLALVLPSLGVAVHALVTSLDYLT